MLFNSSKSLCEIHAKIIVCKENKAEYCAYNPCSDSVYKFKIDGDIISSSEEGLRCDYLVENETKRHAYFIELKGSDIAHAFLQIEATVNRYKMRLKDYEIRPRIIYRNNTHDIRGSQARQFKAKYKNAVLKSQLLTENL